MSFLNNIVNSIYGNNDKPEEQKIARKNGKRVPRKDGIENLVAKRDEEQRIAETERINRELSAKQRKG